MCQPYIDSAVVSDTNIGKGPYGAKTFFELLIPLYSMIFEL